MIAGYTICFSETFKLKDELQDNVTGAGHELEMKNIFSQC
jgi:hypothetical protein